MRLTKYSMDLNILNILNNYVYYIMRFDAITYHEHFK